MATPPPEDFDDEPSEVPRLIVRPGSTGAATELDDEPAAFDEEPATHEVEPEVEPAVDRGPGPDDAVVLLSTLRKHR